jgi:oligo-1,6-glucosidase
LKENNGDLKAFLDDRKQTSRENGRTPFQWNSKVNAGFTTGKPWLKVNPNYTNVNVETLEKDSNSTLNYFRKLVQLRKSNPVLIYGKYTLLDRENPKVFAYTREFEGKKMLVMLNFSSDNATVNIGINLSNSKIICSNYFYLDLIKNSILRPYEALIIEIN